MHGHLNTVLDRFASCLVLGLVVACLLGLGEVAVDVHHHSICLESGAEGAIGVARALLLPLLSPAARTDLLLLLPPLPDQLPQSEGAIGVAGALWLLQIVILVLSEVRPRHRGQDPGQRLQRAQEIVRVIVHGFLPK